MPNGRELPENGCRARHLTVKRPNLPCDRLGSERRAEGTLADYPGKRNDAT